jgi:hypothetical protein
MISVDAIKSHFAANDINYLQSPDETHFVVNWSLGRYDVRTEIRILEDNRFLYLKTADMPRVEREHPAYYAMLERLNELTFKYRAFKATLDPSDGEIRVSFESWHIDGVLSDETFEQHYRGFLHFLEMALEVLDETLLQKEPTRVAC